MQEYRTNPWEKYIPTIDQMTKELWELCHSWRQNHKSHQPRTQICVILVTPLLSKMKLTKRTTIITAHVGSIAQVVHETLLPIHSIYQDKTCNLQWTDHTQLETTLCWLVSPLWVSLHNQAIQISMIYSISQNVSPSYGKQLYTTRNYKISTCIHTITCKKTILNYKQQYTKSFTMLAKTPTYMAW